GGGASTWSLASPAAAEFRRGAGDRGGEGLAELPFASRGVLGPTGAWRARRGGRRRGDAGDLVGVPREPEAPDRRGLERRRAQAARRAELAAFGGLVRVALNGCGVTLRVTSIPGRCSGRRSRTRSAPCRRPTS